MNGRQGANIARSAQIDTEPDDRVAFAKYGLAKAREQGQRVLVWSFYAKQQVENLAFGTSELARVAARLHRDGRVQVGETTVVLDTPRMRTSAASSGMPVAVWWGSDDRLLDLESRRPPILAAFLSATSRAPIWLTAYNVDPGAKVGVEVPGSGIVGEPGVTPIAVDAELQEQVDAYSRGMNLVNGVHDSCAGPLLSYARAQIHSDMATPEAIAVAALRCGWWPDRIGRLLEKLR